MASLEETSYDIAVRALEQQERSLDELRRRTGSLLTAASLVTSFLGSQAIARHGLSGWIVAALVAFAALVVLAAFVLLPKRDLVFALDAPATYHALYAVSDDENEICRRLAFWLQSFRGLNQESIRRTGRAFEVACTALTTEIALLGLGLALT
jgi:hypothetical protein